jgi:hypothetical protein
MNDGDLRVQAAPVRGIALKPQFYYLWHLRRMVLQAARRETWMSQDFVQ